MDTDAVGTVKAYLGVKQVKLQQDVQVNILRQIMNQEKQSVQDLLETMPQTSPNPPHLGNNLDLYV
ncbi:MAG: hypothetical protein A4E52_00367 [Pelotomaculum sp. PtaB.Bin013]|uniref:YjfB family protein n=1 Tax=Pelotomaculum isophthalicicum JI TaxID=947010 RepID=A0A9X4H3X6_9FIRM|nr:YjfB family protein [Pelotomaculum isophthalicicum]MDF9409406.1 YjfB family protein [Pelotomaculum isophthalicicum JI]OPX91753.1 MAG: hypothetical protein A4E52_00367 [Pelotomaculum sp. PtaB.Bin013]